MKPYDIIDPNHPGIGADFYSWIVLALALLLLWAFFYIYLQQKKTNKKYQKSDLALARFSLEQELITTGIDYLDTPSKNSLSYFLSLCNRYTQMQEAISIDDSIKKISKLRYAKNLSPQISISIREILQNIDNIS